MRCLYCGKQLALFRRLTGQGEFCSETHKQSYYEEYNRLALTRLIAGRSKSEQAPPLVSSAVELAAGGGPKQKKLPSPRNMRSGLRWSELVEPGGQPMIAAPIIEPTPPKPASFLSNRPKPVPANHQTTDSVPLEALPAGIQSRKPDWMPAPARVKEVEPPPADHIQTETLPQGRASEAELPNQQQESLAFHPQSTLPPELALRVEPRFAGGLQPRPARVLDPSQFAPRPKTEPEYQTHFEPFRFAVTLFGAPELTVIGAKSPTPAPTQSEPVAPPAGFEPQTAFQAVRTALQQPEALSAKRLEVRPAESKRPAAVKVKLAALAAATAPSPVSPAPQAAPQPAPNPAPAASPAPKRTSGMPSILNPNPSPPERKPHRSLWDSLRNYLKK